ncbi:Hypothetical predicted protein [Cloeon dipterum]|uniref:Uncharacterized protein n=1 Tax=Cloeon dipterum TaxID=197152 RepID=A0A8S1DQ58_9INSE|nr:Hypothetical predicted protein [Cloeon dipterum]
MMASAGCLDDFFRAQPAPAGLQQEETRSAYTFQSWTPSPWVLLISEATEENLQETLNHAWLLLAPNFTVTTQQQNAFLSFHLQVSFLRLEDRPLTFTEQQKLHSSWNGVATSGGPALTILHEPRR